MSGKFLYRVLRDDEDYRKGLEAKDPQANVSVDDHVGSGSSQGFKSKFISTSKTLEAAELFASKSYHKPKTIVQIDLKKLQQVHEQEFQDKFEESQLLDQQYEDTCGEPDDDQYILEQLELDRQQDFEDSQYQLQQHYEDTWEEPQYFEDCQYQLQQQYEDTWEEPQDFEDYQYQLQQYVDTYGEPEDDQYILEQLELDRQQDFEDSRYQLQQYQDTQNDFEDLPYYLEQLDLDNQQQFEEVQSQLQQIREDRLRAAEESRIIDLQGYKFKTSRADNFARKFKEVLIVGKVPASCVSFCKLVS